MAPVDAGPHQHALADVTRDLAPDHVHGEAAAPDAMARLTHDGYGSDVPTAAPRDLTHAVGATRAVARDLAPGTSVADDRADAGAPSDLSLVATDDGPSARVVEAAPLTDAVGATGDHLGDDVPVATDAVTRTVRDSGPEPFPTDDTEVTSSVVDEVGWTHAATLPETDDVTSVSSVMGEAAREPDASDGVHGPEVATGPVPSVAGTVVPSTVVWASGGGRGPDQATDASPPDPDVAGAVPETTGAAVTLTGASDGAGIAGTSEDSASPAVRAVGPVAASDAGPAAGVPTSRPASVEGLFRPAAAAPPRSVRTFEWGGVARVVSESTNESCRWPSGDVRGGDFAFCGRRRTGGTSYCDDHRSLAYATPTRSAVRLPPRVA